MSTALAARPVTPLGILAQRLDRVAAGLADVSGIGEDVRADLAAARELAAGLDPYLERVSSPESPALAELARATAARDWGAVPVGDGSAPLEQEMLSGHVEGRLLRFLVRATRARRVLDIGMFTGYSALAMAEALPADGVVVACELDAGVADFARERLAASPAGARVDVRVGPALDTLRGLAGGGAFDLVFLDADKPSYAAYLDAVLDDRPGRALLSEGGVVCVDNTLMQGMPWSSRARTANGEAIAAFNERVAADPRVEQVLIPLRDGLTLLQRVP